jgi:CRP/FNR family cyclic AMP-dependent transcriptional regulator
MQSQDPGEKDAQIGGAPGPAAASARDARTLRAERIRRLPILREATAEARERAADVAVWRQYEPGEMIVNIDDPSGDVWFVIEGAVRIQVRTPAGRELILSDVQAGDMFGEIAAIDGAPRTAAATALFRSQLCKVPGDAFLAAACSTPASALALLRSVTTILRRQSKRLLERESLPVRLRLCAELLRLSRARQPANGDAPQATRVVSPPPRQHVLAARIGARREAVSRDFAELMKRGLVVKERGALVLPQPETLRQMVEAELEAEAGL